MVIIYSQRRVLAARQAIYNGNIYRHYLFITMFHHRMTRQTLNTCFYIHYSAPPEAPFINVLAGREAFLTNRFPLFGLGAPPFGLFLSVAFKFDHDWWGCMTVLNDVFRLVMLLCASDLSSATSCWCLSFVAAVTALAASVSAATVGEVRWWVCSSCMCNTLSAEVRKCFSLESRSSAFAPAFVGLLLGECAASAGADVGLLTGVTELWVWAEDRKSVV